MRTLKITLGASSAGWLVGLAGSTLATARVWLNSPSTEELLRWELLLACGVTLVILPVCGLVVAPLVRYLLAKPSHWSPTRAAMAGGIAGMIAFGALAVAISVVEGGNIFQTEPMFILLLSLASVACAVGATTGAVGAVLARIF